MVSKIGFFIESIRRFFESFVILAHSATYLGEHYAAGTKIPLQDEQNFTLDVPAGVEFEDVIYILEKGEYVL